MSNEIQTYQDTTSEFLFVLDSNGLSPTREGDHLTVRCREEFPLGSNIKPQHTHASLHNFIFPLVRFDAKNLSFVPAIEELDMPESAPIIPSTPDESEESDSPPAPPLPQGGSPTLQILPIDDEIEEGELVECNEASCTQQQRSWNELDVKAKGSNTFSPHQNSLKSRVPESSETASVVNHEPTTLRFSDSKASTSSSESCILSEHILDTSKKKRHRSPPVVSYQAIKTPRNLLSAKSHSQTQVVDLDFSDSSLSRADMEESEQDEDNKNLCLQYADTNTSCSLQLIKSVKRLVPDEIDRECTWSLWVLQEALGNQFPSNLKRIAEPGLSCRPLRSLRYTSFAESLVALPSFWKSPLPNISAAHGALVLSQDELHTFRSMVNCPNDVSDEPTQAAACRYCATVECIHERRFRCWKARCARCYREGHGTQRCYQDGPDKWVSRFLVPFNEEYFKSLRRQLMNPYHKKICAVSCITCYSNGHASCSESYDPQMSSHDMTTRFPILSCDELLSKLGPLYNHTRWDTDAAPFQRHSSAFRSRYSVHISPNAQEDLYYRPRRHSESFSWSYTWHNTNKQPLRNEEAGKQRSAFYHGKNGRNQSYHGLRW